MALLFPVLFLLCLVSLGEAAFDPGCRSSEETHYSNYGKIYEKVAGYPNLDGMIPAPINRYYDMCLSTFNDLYESPYLVTHTKFGQTACKQQCIALYAANRDGSQYTHPRCGPRRKPLQWSSKAFGEKETVTKIGCQDLNLMPYSDGRKYQDFPHRFMRLLHEDKANGYKDFLPEYYALLSTLKPTHMQLYYTDKIHAPQNATTYRSHLGSIMDSFGESLESLMFIGTTRKKDMHYDLAKELKKLPNLKYFQTQNTYIDTLDFFAHPEKLVYLGIKIPLNENDRDPNLDLNPEWLTRAKNLQVILMMTAMEFSNFKNYENLPELEIFRVQQSLRLDHIPKGFLAGSPKLKSLDLSCNLINRIEPGSFDTFTELLHIRLSGNPLTTIHPSTFASLPNLRIVEIRIDRPYPDATRLPFTAFRDITNGLQQFYRCRDIYRGAPKPVPKRIFVEQSAEHFKHNPKITEMILSGSNGIREGNPGVNIDPELFSQLKDMEVLFFTGMGLKSMEPLKGSLMNCKTRVYSLYYNDFSDPNWLSYEWVSNMKASTEVFYFGKSNVTKVTAPIYFLTMIGETTKFQVSDSLSQNPVGQDFCQMSVWNTLMRNQYVLPDMPGIDSACKQNFQKLLKEIEIWKPKIFSPQQMEHCPEVQTAGVGRASIGGQVLMVVVALLLLGPKMSI